MSLPTSVLVALLALAWLFVLVPMFARRRQAVPDAYESTARFRVLGSGGSTRRRRPHFGRRARGEDDMQDEQDFDEPSGELDEELLDSDEEIDADDEIDAESDESDYEDEYEDEVREARRPAVAHASSSGVRRFRSRRAARVEYDQSDFEPGDDAADDQFDGDDGYADDEDLDEAVAGWESPAGATPYRSPRSAGHPGHEDGRTAEARVPAGTLTLEPELEEDPRYRPIPRRAGRGGFNPEAAERLRAQRYRRRRRIVLVLILLTVLTGVAAHYTYPEIWGATGVFGLLLVLYMLYLRRQVKIETDIRRRRMAKLQRARQTRPEYHSDRRTSVTPFAEDAPIAVTPPRRPQYHDWQAGHTVVDLDDEDPSFDDLEYYRPVSYRKAVGQ